MPESIFWNQVGAIIAVLAIIVLATFGEWCAYKDRTSAASRTAQRALRRRPPMSEEEVRDLYAAHRAEDARAQVARLALEYSERAEGALI